MTLQIENTKVVILIDSGSICSILGKSLTTEFFSNSFLAQWLTTKTAKYLKTFVNMPIPVIGLMQTPVASIGGRIEDAEFVVIRDGLKPLIGRDLFGALGISVTHTLNPISGNMVKNINTQCSVKIRIPNKLPKLISPFARSEYQMSNQTFTNAFNQNTRKVDEYLSIYMRGLILKLEDYFKKDMFKKDTR